MKSYSEPHKAGIRPGRRPLELIYSDVCRLITPRSKGGGKFFVTFYDDWDKRSEVEVLEYKSEVFPAFKRF